MPTCPAVTSHCIPVVQLWRDAANKKKEKKVDTEYTKTESVKKNNSEFQGIQTTFVTFSRAIYNVTRFSPVTSSYIYAPSMLRMALTHGALASKPPTSA